MPSKALYLLWIVYITLPNYLLAGQEEDDADAERFKELYNEDNEDVSDILLKEMSDGGKEFIHPDDPNKVVRIYKFPTLEASSIIVQEQAVLDKLMAKSQELGNGIPITQKLYRVLNFPFDGQFGISFEMERMRTTLLTGISLDPALRASLADFGKRLEMYQQLAYSFQQLAALDIKYCNIEVQRILYKKPTDDFTTWPPDETDSPFNFVLSDFRFSTDLATPCQYGISSTWDHDDALQQIPKSAKCKGKIEIFGLALLILKIETIALMIAQEGIEQDVKCRPKNIVLALRTMPDAPQDIDQFYPDKDTIMKYTNYDILDTIMNWNDYANQPKLYARKRNVNLIFGKALLPNLAYVEMANGLVFEQKDLERHSALADNAGVKDKVVANYAAFNKLLQSMVKPNDYVNGRPDAAETNTALIKIQQAYVANIQSLARDRILLV